MAEEIERIYVIPLKKFGMKSSTAAPTAVKRVKKYLTRHMKVEQEKIWIDDSLNNELWSRGKYKMPSKIRVKAVKFEDGVVEAYLPELTFKKSRRELLKEEKEKEVKKTPKKKPSEEKKEERKAKHKKKTAEKKPTEKKPAKKTTKKPTTTKKKTTSKTAKKKK